MGQQTTVVVMGGPSPASAHIRDYLVENVLGAFFCCLCIGENMILLSRKLARIKFR